MFFFVAAANAPDDLNTATDSGDPFSGFGFLLDRAIVNIQDTQAKKPD